MSDLLQEPQERRVGDGCGRSPAVCAPGGPRTPMRVSAGESGDLRLDVSSNEFCRREGYLSHLLVHQTYAR